MASTHTLELAAILLLSIVLVSYADPGHHHHHHHSKHVIHAPLHIKLIHHHKIIKVPVVFRKHLHHHKHFSHENVYIPLKEKPKPVYEDVDVAGGVSGFGNGQKHVVEYGSYDGDSVEGGDAGDNGGHGHYQSHIGRDGNGGYGFAADKSEDNSYEYEEQQDAGAHSSYSYHGIH